MKEERKGMEKEREVRGSTKFRGLAFVSERCLESESPFGERRTHEEESTRNDQQPNVFCTFVTETRLFQHLAIPHTVLHKSQDGQPISDRDGREERNGVRT